MTDRATSTMLSYALTLSIITLLVSGVFVAAGGYVEDQQERSIRAELDVIGNRVAADVATVDRLALADESSSARVTVTLPDHVAGSSYRMEIGDLGGDLHAINLSTTNPNVETTVTVKANSTLLETDFSGGDIVIVYDGTAMEVQRD